MIELPGLWSLTPLGALIGVLVLFYWITATGRYIPRSSHERELTAANARTQDAKDRGDEFREAAREWKAVAEKVIAQNATLVETSAVIQDVLRESSPTRFGSTGPRGGG